MILASLILFCQTVYSFAFTNSRVDFLNKQVKRLGSSRYDTNLYPLEIVIHEDKVDLVSKIFRYEMKSSLSNATPAIVDLFSMVHIADLDYYQEIQRLCENYDLVLYELITSEDLVSYAEGDRDASRVRKQLTTKVVASRADGLAQQYNLSLQLDRLDLLRDNWFIADLSKEVIDKLEGERMSLTNNRFLASQIGGRGFSERITLRNFFLSDSTFITLLRLLSWLLPCPEAAILLLDWSRMSPRPGGLPPVLVPMFENLLAGDLEEARKLAFAQQLLSGLPDAGGWGGAARSDVEVRVRARNKECCRVLGSFLQEAKGEAVVEGGDKGPRKVALLYGAYHVADLHERLLRLGLRPSAGDAKTHVVPSGLVAWSMKRPRPRLRPFSMGLASDSRTALVAAELETSSSSPSTSSSAEERSSQPSVWVRDTPASRGQESHTESLRTLAVVLLPLYLLLGAVDWSLAQSLLAQALSTALKGSSSGLADTAGLGLGLSSGSGSGASLVALSLLYLGSYVQRHAGLLQTLAGTVVQWDRPLFDLSTTTTTTTTDDDEE